MIDGIVLHQILQWHHLLSSTGEYPATTVPGLKVNSLWDGLFHMATYVFIVLGILMIWSRGRDGAMTWLWRGLLGWMLVGWGLFDVIEGLTNHHILKIHHVRSGPDQLAYDLGYLAFGALLVVVGVLLERSADGDSHRRPRQATR